MKHYIYKASFQEINSNENCQNSVNKWYKNISCMILVKLKHRILSENVFMKDLFSSLLK